MNELLQSPFLVTACAAGVEPWLRAELAREQPGLVSDFVRPGLVTWRRGEGAPPAADVRSVFATVVAASLGEVEAPGAVAARVRALLDGADAPLRLQVHGSPPRPRDPRFVGLADEVRDRLVHQHALEQRVAIVGALGEDARRLARGELAVVGDVVLDVLTAPGEPSWLGLHRHTAERQPWPAGRSPVELPPEAPSRGYAKLEEALLWSRAPMRAGDLAVEIGSAPGGASLSLLRRGLDVIGIDPAEMDPRVLALAGSAAGSPRFRHLKAAIGAVKKGDLPRDVAWLVLDVKLAPPIALRHLERVAGLDQAHLFGAVLTLKVNDATMAARVPTFLERVRALGFGALRATQLPSNRREICVVALTERGAGRRAGGRPAPK